MPRSLTTDQLTALSSGQINPALFIEITFGNGFTDDYIPIPEIFYLWNGIGTTTFNGHSWQGIGSFMKMTVLEDTAQVEAKGVVLTLSGIDPALLTDSLGDIIQGFPVIIHLGLFDLSGTLIDTPITLWAGMVDQATVSITGTTATIDIACESRLLDMNVSVDKRYTNQQIQSENPGDTGCMFVSGLQEQAIDWGSVITTSNI